MADRDDMRDYMEGASGVHRPGTWGGQVGMQQHAAQQGRNGTGSGGGGAVEKKGSSFWQTTLLIVGGIWLYGTFAGSKTEKSRTVPVSSVPAPVATLPDTGVDKPGGNPLSLDTTPPEPVQSVTVKSVHGATQLHSAEVMNVYRGVIGSADFQLPEMAKAQFDAGTRTLLASGQKILRCVYRASDGYVTYDFWHNRVPQAAVSLHAIDPKADIRFMGLDAFDRCPDDADTALYIRQRMMNAADSRNVRE